MNIFQNYKSKLLDNQNEDVMSNSSLASSIGGNHANQDLFGNEEIERKGKPVKGKRYLLYTIFMTIFLSVLVIINVKNTSLQDIADEKTAQDQETIVDPSLLEPATVEPEDEVEEEEETVEENPAEEKKNTEVPAEEVTAPEK